MPPLEPPAAKVLVRVRASGVELSYGDGALAVVHGLDPHPARLIDLFTNRQLAESMAFEYYRQTARTNNATAVADLATKPTSVLTVQAIQDRCRVVAHLSEQPPEQTSAA